MQMMHLVVVHRLSRIRRSNYAKQRECTVSQQSRA